MAPTYHDVATFMDVMFEKILGWQIKRSLNSEYTYIHCSNVRKFVTFVYFLFSNLLTDLLIKLTLGENLIL